MPKFLSKLDIYGYPLKLSFRGQSTHKTNFGGILTLFQGLVIFSYFAFLVSKIYERKFTITNTKFLRDLGYDTAEYDLDGGKFDYGIYVYNSFYPDLNIDEYLSIKTIYGESYWETGAAGIPVQIYNADEIQMEKCKKGRFNGLDNQTSTMGITGNFFCQKQMNYSISGSWWGKEIKYIEIGIYPCEQKTLDSIYPGENRTCRTDNYENVLAYTEVQFAVLEKYFDTNNFEGQEIQNSIISHYETIHPDIGATYEFKLNKNYANFSNSWFGNMGSESKDYYTTNRLTPFIQKPIGGIPLMAFQFTMGNEVSTTSRIRYTFIDALSGVGGLSSVLTLFCRAIASSIQELLFKILLIKSMFVVPKTKVTKNPKKKRVSEEECKKMLEKRIYDNEVLQLTVWQQLRTSCGNKIRACFCLKGVQTQTQHFFQQGERKLQKALDFMELFKAQRLNKLLFRILFKKYQLEFLSQRKINILKAKPLQDSKGASMEHFPSETSLSKSMARILQSSNQKDKTILKVLLKVKPARRREEVKRAENFGIESFREEEAKGEVEGQDEKQNQTRRNFLRTQKGLKNMKSKKKSDIKISRIMFQKKKQEID